MFRNGRKSCALFVALVAALVTMGSTTVAGAQADESPIPEMLPPGDLTVSLEPVAGGFTSPVLAIAAPRNNDQLYVVDQIGTITAVNISGDPSVPARVEFLDIGAGGLDLLVPLGAFGPGSFDERGLLGLAFDPRYYAKGRLYTYSSEPIGNPADFSTQPAGVDANSQSVIRQWTVADPKSPTATVDPASGRVLMRIDQPQFNHNGGMIAFGHDNLLYIAVGDGGGADDQGVGHAVGGNGQDLSDGNVLGKILRINPRGSNSANGEYGVPRGNPMVGSAGADEIWAYGFRNPFRMSFDQRTGELYAADVGQNDIEEVDLVLRGRNYGWPIKEGTFLFDMNGDEDGFVTANSPNSPFGLKDPIAQYDHDEGISVTGGFVYRGAAMSGLRGDYVFSDWRVNGPDGHLLRIDQGELKAVEVTGGVGSFVTGFGQDNQGEMYVLGQQGFAPVGTTGEVRKIVVDG